MPPRDRALAFRRLHSPGRAVPLVLPNAWDALSARIIEDAGAQAIATTSAGIAWAHGHGDGEAMTRAEMIAAVRRIVRAVQLPVSADVESGYGMGSPEDVVATVLDVLDAGAVGINLEDGPGRRGQGLFEMQEQVVRITAARAVAPRAELFINARTDLYLRQVGAPEHRFDETVRRARAYLQAGADGIFVPGVTDAATIERLVGAIDAPLNVLVGPASPSLPRLGEMGVARASTGSSIALATAAHVRRAAVELLTTGTYDALQADLTYHDANSLFAGPA